jgi:AcrR family transcriptional regulator
MPPKTTVTKDIVLNAAFELVRNKGIGSITARNIAEEIGCSTQPVYRLYENMEALKADLFCKMDKYAYSQIINYKAAQTPFHNMGLGYINFAKNETNLFIALYMSQYLNFDFNSNDPFNMTKNIEYMKQDPKLSKYTDEQLKDIFIKMWIFAHGIASLVSTNKINISEEKISQMLTDIFIQIVKAYYSN